MEVLQQLTGHSNIAATRTFYIQAADAGKRDAVGRFERRLSAPASTPQRTGLVAADASAQKQVNAMWLDRREFFVFNDLRIRGDRIRTCDLLTPSASPNKNRS
jgi:hypothetical protein